MPIIDISKIKVLDNRIRREFDGAKLLQLKDSITSVGLLHPIVVDAGGDGSYVLTVGERRLRSITALHQEDKSIIFENRVVPRGYIPASFLNELTAEQKLEAELQENVIRADLSWSEIVEAEAKLHAFRAQQNPKQTVKATASEIVGGEASPHDQTSVQHSIFLHQHMADPEIAGAKSKKEAFNIAKRKVADTFQQALAKLQGNTPVESRHTLINGDMLSSEIHEELLSREVFFDVLITDPPYGIGADKFDTMSDSESGMKHEYDDSENYAMACYEAAASLGFILTKPSAHGYIFFDLRYYQTIKNIFRSYGWLVHDYPIIWDKTTGMLGDSTRVPRRTYETILYIRKGDKKVNAVANDIVRLSYQGEKLHAAEKPVELYVDLLRRSCLPGDHIVDFFAGSGTVFAAADKLSLRATGVEKNLKSFGIAQGRLK